MKENPATKIWVETQLSALLEQARDPVSLIDDQEYRQITVALQGRGIRLRRLVKGCDVRTKNQHRVRTGQFVYSRIDARNGAMGLVPTDLDGAIASGDFPAFNVREAAVDSRFLAYLVRSRAFVEKCRDASRGVTNRRRVKENQLLALTVLLPPRSQQERILATLSRGEQLRNTASSLNAAIAEEQDALLSSLVHEISRDVPTMSMSEVAPLVRRPVAIDKTAEYPELGIRSFGRGTFHKPVVKGSELTWQRLYVMRKGDLLFSNIKAWEGAVAVVQPEDDGRVGGHRYLTCVANPGKATPEFIAQWFLTPKGLRSLGGASPGATDRNRTLGMDKLMTIRVPVPPLADQQRFSAIQDRVNAARRIHTQTAAELETLMPAILDKAFKGEL